MVDSSSSKLPQELAAALERFRTLVDPEFVNSLCPTHHNAIYTSWVVVWLLVYQRLHSNAPLQQAVDEFVTMAASFSTNKRVRQRTLSPNTSAYSQARTRLTVDAANAVADHVFESIVTATPPSWLERRVYTMDGSTLALASNDELRQCWPAGSNQHGPGTWPIGHLVLAHELASGAAVRAEIGAMYGPEAQSELSLALRLLPRIPANSVLMADRNFGVFRFVYAAATAGHDVLVRLTRPRFKALKRSAELVSPGCWVLTWRPSRTERRAHPELPADAAIRVWLREFVGFSGQTLWIATTCEATERELADLYAQRWNIETDIRQLKQTLECEELRGQSEEMIRKELAMAMVAFNLIVQIRQIAARRRNLPPRRLSFTGVWSLVTHVLFRPHDDWTEEEWEANFEWVLRGAVQRKLPNRPGRSYPRVILSRGHPYPERRHSSGVREPVK